MILNPNIRQFLGTWTVVNPKDTHHVPCTAQKRRPALAIAPMKALNWERVGTQNHDIMDLQNRWEKCLLG
jgi:hypothetical protein